MVLSRRTVLQASVSAATGLAGCLGFGGTNEEIDVTLRNQDDAAHQLTVTVTFDGETLVEQTASLDAGASAGTSFRNPNSAGEALVEAAVADGPRTTARVRVGPGTGIRSLAVVITSDGRVAVRATRT